MNVAVDGNTFSISSSNELRAKLSAGDIELVNADPNLIDAVRNAAAAEEVFDSQTQIHPLGTEFTGVSHSAKIEDCRQHMAQVGASALVLTATDEVAWLLNLRGRGEVPYNPIFFGYAVLTQDSVRLFVDQQKLSSTAATHLDEADVQVEDYEEFLGVIRTLQGKVWIDPACTSWATELALSHATLHQAKAPVVLAKATKNETELKCAEAAHAVDAVAMARFLHWLDALDTADLPSITEMHASQILEKFRQDETLDCFVMPSFCTIAGYESNGAIIHYRPEEQSCKPLGPGAAARYGRSQSDRIRAGMFLCDSGGQWLGGEFGGTTDVTRTVHLGKPSAEQIDLNTRVLKGHISLATCKFPLGTTGHQLDGFARRALWDIGCDYAHGTGHGVGAFLNVRHINDPCSCCMMMVSESL